MKKRKTEFDYRKYGKLGWFSTLETALEENDFKKAALAQDELKKLGVTVKFRGKTSSKRPAGDIFDRDLPGSVKEELSRADKLLETADVR